MDTRTGESGGEPAATILDNNTGIATTAGPLAESSTSSSSSSSSPSASSSSSAVAPTVILTESTATNAGNLSLTGSSQQQSLHQVHQQQQTRQRVNLIADVAANDVTVSSFLSFYVYSLRRNEFRYSTKLVCKNIRHRSDTKIYSIFQIE
ncbi:hypothetical protein ACS0PU_000921 [Formica fusca]